MRPPVSEVLRPELSDRFADWVMATCGKAIALAAATWHVVWPGHWPAGPDRPLARRLIVASVVLWAGTVWFFTVHLVAVVLSAWTERGPAFQVDLGDPLSVLLLASRAAVRHPVAFGLWWFSWVGAVTFATAYVRSRRIALVAAVVVSVVLVAAYFGVVLSVSFQLLDALLSPFVLM